MTKDEIEWDALKRRKDYAEALGADPDTVNIVTFLNGARMKVYWNGHFAASTAAYFQQGALVRGLYALRDYVEKEFKASPCGNYAIDEPGDKIWKRWQNFFQQRDMVLELPLVIGRADKRFYMMITAPEKKPFRKFNGYPHLEVEVPNGGFTITARTADNKRMTFAFVPDTDGTPICCDISYYDAPVEKIQNGDHLLSPQHVIGFTAGTNTFDTRKIEKPTTLITVLMADKYYKNESKD